ncbi:MAG: hypothetical protein IJ809_07580 [Clostridia bacterium]|nr:hypothetical protein [Clostridia bacterium]
MKNVVRELLDFVVKNKYIIAFVVIVVFLYAIGLLKFLTEIFILIVLVTLAIYFGKKLQDKDWNIKDLFNRTSKDGEFRKEGNVYYYEPSKSSTKSDKKDKENSKTKDGKQ